MAMAARVTDMIASAATSGTPVPILPPGIPTVLIGDLPAATLGATCGPDAVVMGSSTVLIGGQPAARVGDATGGGGAILPPGCVTVIIGG